MLHSSQESGIVSGKHGQVLFGYARRARQSFQISTNDGYIRKSGVDSQSPQSFVIVESQVRRKGLGASRRSLQFRLGAENNQSPAWTEYPADIREHRDRIRKKT
jgi:hypothetical protein